jgi:hypothetical protein
MDKDPIMEILSDKVRRGEPIAMMEAMQVASYQSQRKAYIKSLPWYKRMFSSDI